MKKRSVIHKLTALALCLCILFSASGGGYLFENVVSAAGLIDGGLVVDDSSEVITALANDEYTNLRGQASQVTLLAGTGNPLKGFTLKETKINYENSYLLGIAADFCVFLKEDFKVSDSDAEGRVAVGGDFIINTQSKNYAVGMGDYYTHASLDTLLGTNDTVKLSNSSINGQFGGMYFVNGVARFTLRHGESKDAANLPVGIGYMVMEDSAFGYVVTSSGSVGIINAHSISVAAFTNTKDILEVETPEEQGTTDEESEIDGSYIEDIVDDTTAEEHGDSNPSTGRRHSVAPLVALAVGILAAVSVRRKASRA